MKGISIVGAILIAIGILGFVLGGVSYQETETVAEIGDFSLKDTDEKTFSLPPLASGAILGTGVILLILGVARKE